MRKYGILSSITCSANKELTAILVYNNDFGYSPDVPTSFTGFNEICEAITKST